MHWSWSHTSPAAIMKPATPLPTDQQTVVLLPTSSSVAKTYLPIPVDHLEEEYRLRSADDGKLFREEFSVRWLGLNRMNGKNMDTHFWRKYRWLTPYMSLNWEKYYGSVPLTHCPWHRRPLEIPYWLFVGINEDLSQIKSSDSQPMRDQCLYANRKLKLFTASFFDLQLYSSS